MEQWQCLLLFDRDLKMSSPAHGVLSASSSCHRMRETKGVKLSTNLLLTFGLLCSVLSTAFGFSECGDYYWVGPGETGVINSPDYPSMYPTYSKCIWLIESSGDDYRVRFTLSYTGERYNGTCADFVEVRDGGQYAPLLATFCDTAVNEVVISGYKWMWIMFKSDGLTLTSSVMTATFESVYNTTPSTNKTKPFNECHSYEFECRNKMCASLAYRCDNVNDCGCKDECDEDECYTLSIGKGVQIGISVAVGVFAFLVVCLLSFLIEGQHSWANSLTMAKRERETIEEQRRKRVSRAFSKFTGKTDSSILRGDANSNAIRKPLKIEGNTTNRSSNPNSNNLKVSDSKSSELKGRLETLKVPPRNVPAFRITDMTVTDIDA